MTDAYSNDVLRLAADIAHLGRLAAPDASARRVSRICGSTLTLDVVLDPEGRISDLGLEVEACALGQAAASVFAAHAVGADLEAVTAGRDQLKAMLSDGAAPPAGRFSALCALEPARSYRQRHGSILLAFEAGVEAMEAALKLRL
jgi:NifU-like protein involved in Fe-S cluster formation